VTRQETTFTRTISRNQKLQAKTPEKEHFNMASQAECESCFQAKLLISLSFSGGMVNATALMLQPGPSPASGVRPPHLRSVPPISRLAPWFLHTSNTVFCKCTPLLVFGPSSVFWPSLLLNPGDGPGCSLKVLLKKAIQSRRYSQHCQILTLSLLRSFALFIAPDGITDFAIALAEHCNLVFCSFVLRID